MLQSVSDMENYAIISTTGRVGHVEDFFFDDEQWAIRYLVVDTAPLFFGRKVLISPFSITEVSTESGEAVLNVSKDKIKNSPEIDTARPISRQHETQLNDYYSWPSYWQEGGLWYMANTPHAAVTSMQIEAEHQKESPPEGIPETVSDPHLRSTREVLTYEILGTDDQIGKANDFVVSEGDWALRYLIVDAGPWLLGKKAIIAVDWIQSVSWKESQITVDVSRGLVSNAPEFTSLGKVDRDYEKTLFSHYNRRGYWE